MAQVDFHVHTNLDPQQLTLLGLEVFKQWLAFAVGAQALGGKRLFFPTGRYASSIRFEQKGESEVAIIADESVAPEAMWLETGHGKVDLKTRLEMGKVYRFHNPMAGAAMKSATGLARRRRTSGIGSTPKFWAQVKVSERTGYGRIGPHTPADSWIIPAMPAYSPAALMADYARQQATGGTG
jgi:hypothetical protein